jgi:hypothetical protein
LNIDKICHKNGGKRVNKYFLLSVKVKNVTPKKGQ